MNAVVTVLRDRAFARAAFPNGEVALADPTHPYFLPAIHLLVSLGGGVMMLPNPPNDVLLESV